MATEDTNHGADYPRARSPIKAAAILLGIYIAMYLAVAGMVRVLTSPDALAATVPDTSTASPADATPRSSPTAVVESPRSDPLIRESERKDGSRECKPSAAVDSDCIYGD